MSFFKKNKHFLNNLFKKKNKKKKKPKNKKVDDLEDMKKEYEKIYIMKI